ncbi:MAG: NAD kinase [Dysgonamonadaceae bacterium]|nr:NAD kinase [Dysgonamonadaceae bacterium]
MKIGVFGSGYQEDKYPLIWQLFGKLNALGTAVYVKQDLYDFLVNKLDYRPTIAGVLKDRLFDLDLALSVGGDGTFLQTAVQIHKQHIPILGINTGRLGFLADVSANQIEETLEELFHHNYKTEERMLLELHTEKPVFEGYGYALNEVAIQKRDTSSMITIHTSLNNEYLTSYQADGLVIATPTGSTAYSMSVNGPIILPQNDNIVLSPVAPHSLNVRPLVIPGSYRITLTVESRTQSFLISLDGRSEVFSTNTRLTVDKAGFTTCVIKRYQHTFYQTLHEKLMWGVDKRVK